MHKGLVLKHEIDIELPFKSFDRNFKDFKDKHRLGERFVYAINSDGKFRVELKERPDDLKEYVIRISGWREGKVLRLQRIYVSAPQESLYLVFLGVKQQEVRPISLYDYVYDFLDLIEAWAIDHRGCFYLEYVDGDLPIRDAYNIIKGQEKVTQFSDAELQEVLDQWEY